MDIAICTLDTPNIRWFAEHTAASKLEYCERWSCTLIRWLTQDESRPASWTKIALLRKYLTAFDWLWWIDADAVITNHSLDPSTLCDEYADLVISADIHGVNCGSFLVRNTPVVADFLAAVWGRSDIIHNPEWEQRAIREELANFPVRVSVIEKGRINAYPDDFQPGDGVVHCPGQYKPARTRLQQWAREAIR